MKAIKVPKVLFKNLHEWTNLPAQ